MISEDFNRVLARIQTDYEFYISCQTDPAAALAEYNLSPDEMSTLMDAEKLDNLLIQGISITISGKHDWVNRAAPKKKRTTEKDDRNAAVAAEVQAIKRARTDDERTGAALRLMELID
jgi:hypothetical protein